MDGSVTLSRDSLAWEAFPALAEEISATIYARKKSQRTATIGDPAKKKTGGRSRKPIEPVRPRELHALPPATPEVPTWADRFVDAFNADTGPQLTFSRHRGSDTMVFVVHAEERPDYPLAAVDIRDQRIHEVRWLDERLSPAQQTSLTERLERALAHFKPRLADALSHAAIKKLKARALALGADPERTARGAGGEEYRWLAETLRDLAEPRGMGPYDLASWLSAHSLRSAAEKVRQHSDEQALDEFMGELWETVADLVVLSPVERRDEGFAVHQQALHDTDQGTVLVLRETDADGRPRVVPVSMREDCEDELCVIESEELVGGELAWHLGVAWDYRFIHDLYHNIRSFEQNVRSAPQRLADVREMLFWTAAMIDTPRCSGESRRTVEAAFRQAKEHYDRARVLVAQGDSVEALQALHQTLRKIAAAAAELACSCGEGQASLPGTSVQLRAEMRAASPSARPRRRHASARPPRVTASATPPEQPPRAPATASRYEERDFYIYKGDSLCEACGEALRRQLRAQGLEPENYRNEDSYDSEEFPKGPYAPGEADAPAHCGGGRDCLNAEEVETADGPMRVGGFLGNPITAAGEEYVRESVAKGLPIAVQIWGPYYDLPGVTRHHVGEVLGAMPSGGREVLQEWAASEDPSSAVLDFVDEQILDGAITTTGKAAVHEALRLIASESRLPLNPGGDVEAEDQFVLDAFRVRGFVPELVPHLPWGFALVLYAADTKEKAVTIDVIDRETVEFHWYDTKIPYSTRRKVKDQIERVLQMATEDVESSAKPRRPGKPPKANSSAPRGAVTMSPPVLATSGVWRPAHAVASDRRGGRPRRTSSPARASTTWDEIAAESERRVRANEAELVATMVRLTRIYSGGRLAGRRIGPGAMVVERIQEAPEFPSLVLPNLATIADGIDLGAAVAVLGVMPMEVALAEWMEPSGMATSEADRFMAHLEEVVTAYHARRMSEDEFVAKRDALWDEAERAGVAVEVAWRFRKKHGAPPREPPISSSLPAIGVRVVPQFRYLLELHLRQIGQDAHASVISRWVRPLHDHIEAGQGAWQNVLELPILENSTCTHCPFVLGSNLDCETCRRWVLSLKRPDGVWSAERIGAVLHNCDQAEVPQAAAWALEQSTKPPLTAGFFEEFAANFAARLTELGMTTDEGYREHCRKSVEWLFPQPNFPLPAPEPKANARRGPSDVQLSGRARIIDTRGLGVRTVAALFAAHGHRGRR